MLADLLCPRAYVFKPIYILLTRNYASNHRWRAVVQTTEVCDADWTLVSGNTESLNYAGNDETCDHSWLTMLLGTAPLADVQMASPALYSTTIVH